jgi:NADP-dependent aldehyde dehydrogenase
LKQKSIYNDEIKNEKKSFSTFNALLNIDNKEKYFCSTIEETHQAVLLAKESFRNYRLTPDSKRSKFLKTIAENLESKRKSLIEIYCKETSLNVDRANSELDRTILQFQEFANYIVKKDWNKPLESIIKSKNLIIRSNLQAIGTVVVFGASNFPFAYSTAGGDTASALAAGCPVIVKAHPMHVGTSILISECIKKAVKSENLPEGIFSHLIDDGYIIGKELVKNMYVDAIAFTGSFKGGKEIMDLVAQRSKPIPVFAEMGSVNPVILFESELDAGKINKWINLFSESISNDAGQFCTKPGVFFVPETENGNKFIELLKLKLSTINPKCHLHPKLFEQFKNKVEKYFKMTKVEKENHSQPILHEVNISDFLNTLDFKQEFFGPQAIAVKYNTTKELDVFLYSVEGQLTVTFIGTNKDFNEHSDIIELAKERAGRIIFNGVPTGVNVCDAIVHGGTYPATSDSRFTAVGTQSIYRFMRPVSVQTLI